MNQKSTRKAISQYVYVLQDKIGQGAYSQVFKGNHQKTEQNVAIKVVSLERAIKSRTFKNVQLEINSLYALKGVSNIIEVKSAVQTKNNIYIVTQFCDSGNLRQWIKKQKRFSQKTSVDVIQQIINGYRSISKAGFVHRDLKPDNIFINGSEIKIGDFGFAMNSKESQKHVSENIGSPMYMAPEALSSCKYSYKSDIWAIGLIFLEMLNGKCPWKSKTESQLKTELLQFKIEKVIQKNLSQKSIEFLSKTIKPNIAERMSIDQLLSFQFTVLSTQQKIKATIYKEKSISEGRSTIAQSPKQKLGEQILIPRIQSASQIPENKKSTPNLNQVKCKKIQKKNTFSYNSQHFQEVQIKKSQKIFSQIYVQKNIINNTTQPSISNAVSQKLIRNKNYSQPLTILSQKIIQASTASKFLRRSDSVVILQNVSEKSEKNISVPFVSSIDLQQLPELYENQNQSEDEQALKKIQQNKLNRQNQKLIKAQQLQTRLRQTSIVQSAFMEKNQDQKPQNKQPQEEKCLFIEQLKQIGAQISYFKFLNMIMKYFQSCLKIQNEKIQTFKKNIVFLIKSKFQQLSDLKNLKMPSKDYQIFLKTKQFNNYKNILMKMQQKYMGKYSEIVAQSRNHKDFISILSYILILLYKKLQKYQYDFEQMKNKKMVFIIVDSLISLSSLYFLDKQDDWAKFQKKSSIQYLLSRGKPTVIDRQYFETVFKRYDQIASK